MSDSFFGGRVGRYDGIISMSARDSSFSISGDITIMLKDSNGFEHLMPNFNNWTKF